MRQSLGVCLHYMGRKEEAIAHFEEVVAVRRRIGEARPLAVALANLGNQCAETGHPRRGVELLTEALGLLAVLPDSQAVVGITLNNLGWANYRAGRDDAAVDCYRRAAAIAREQDNPQAVSFAEGNLALVYERHNDHEQALRYWRRAARAGRLAGDRRLEANSLAGMGKARIRLGLPAQARSDLRQALAMYLEMGDADAAKMQELLAGLR
jgi:tetratricopeptide (TPR) repeat protein